MPVQGGRMEFNMKDLFQSPLFGIVLCIVCFEVGLWVNKKLKTPLANPLLIAIAMVIIILNVFHIPLEDFQQGGDVISLFLAPATAVLALSIYSQLEVLKKNFLPALVGCTVGSLASMFSAFWLCQLFQLDDSLVQAMIPKSVTTPIAMGISEQHGGLVPVTVAAVIVTGILGAIAAPWLVKLFHVKNKAAAGLAIGTCSHAVGTSKALQMGEIEGAMSSIAMGFSGIITVILSLFY